MHQFEEPRVRSDEFTWADRPGRTESCQVLGGYYNVSAAKRIIATKPRKIVMFQARDWRGLAWIMEFSGDYRPDKDCDLSFPCILAHASGKAYLPIDGWHRIKKAITDGIETLPAVRLTKAETKLITLVD
jgi:hypothetical protein